MAWYSWKPYVPVAKRRLQARRKMDALRKKGVDVQPLLHGGTPVKRRQKLIDEFQRDDGPPYFVLSLKAGGTGLNLTFASHVIFFTARWRRLATGT